MTVVANWQYLQATIKVDGNQCRWMDERELEASLIHELCHCLVCEMRDYQHDEDHEERVVSQLTLALIWTRHAGRQDEKRAGKAKGAK